MKNIVLTGFTPFEGVAENPTETLMKTIQDKQISGVSTCVIPTSYDHSTRYISDILKHPPSVLIMFGVSASSKEIHIERFALNIDDSTAADTCFQIRQGIPIRPDGPAAYHSGLPIEKIHNLLAAHNIPVKISNHAGTYVCNHVFYTAMDYIASQKLPCQAGFIHIPPPETIDPQKIFNAVCLITDYFSNTSQETA